MKVLLAILAVVAILIGVGCLAITPYPVIDTGTGEDVPDAADPDAGSADGGGDG